jgi:SAM-dependent methyltransferase
MYDDFAHYYHLSHQAYAEDVPWLLRWAHGRVLELGCGSGRLLLPLAQAGHEVLGLDLSAPLLAMAAQALAGYAGVQLVQGDMRQFVLEDKGWDTAVVFCNTLLHLDPTELGQMLHTTARHLRPGGRLLIDIPNPFLLAELEDEAESEDEAEPAWEREFVDPATGELVAQYSSTKTDVAGQRLWITWQFLVAGQVRARHTAVYHYYYPHQLQLALQAAGFRLQGFYGDYHGRVFTEESDHLLLIAHRQPASL